MSGAAWIAVLLFFVNIGSGVLCVVDGRIWRAWASFIAAWLLAISLAFRLVAWMGGFDAV
jgi:hypothetical protein